MKHIFNKMMKQVLKPHTCLMLLFMAVSAISQAQIKIDFNQVKNGKGAAAGTIIEFIPSELGPNNSTYTEGMSVPQRVQLTGLSGTTHKLSFKHQIYDPTKSAFAYDFITSWQQAVDNGNGLLNTLMNYTSSLGNPIQVTVDDSYFATNPIAGEDISARTAAYGARTVTLYGDAPITSAVLTLKSVEDVKGNLNAIYELTWESASSSVDLEFAGHLAVTTATANGASKVEGASNHITLEGLDDGGINSRDNPIRLNDAQCPTYNAAAGSNSPVCVGGTINLTSTSVDGADYAWSGPNNFTSAEQNPSIQNATAAAEGTYTLVISSGACSSTSTTDVLVNPLPVVTADAQSVCTGSSVTLTGSPDGGTWSGNYVTGTTFDATGLAAGEYTVTYTYTNANGCTNAATATITVNALPTVSADAQSVCTGSSVTLTGSPDGGTWSGNYVTGTTFDATGLAAGEYTVTYTYTNANGCTNAATATITVNALPTVKVNSATKCASDAAVAITATPESGTAADYNYSWTVPAGVADPGNVQTVNATVAGDYCVTIASKATGCVSAKACGTLTVNPNPPCTITVAGSPTTAVVGSSVTFNGPVAPSGSTYEYTWTLTPSPSGIASFVGSSSTTATRVTVKTTGVGSYSVRLSVKNTVTGCTSVASSSCSYSITVLPIGPSVTYTQGFYGNSGGKACNGKNSFDIMNAALTASGGSVRFGNATDTRSFTLLSADVNLGAKSNIYKMLPGGTTPAVLKTSSVWKSPCAFTTASYANSCTWPSVSMAPGINNVLLAQTMALYFNLNYSSSVGKPIAGLVITGNVLTFAKPTTTCGSTYATTGTTQTIPCTVFNVWKGMSGGATIGNLYAMANGVLGGTLTSVTPSDMNNALNMINTGFDGGAQIIAVSNSTCVAARSAISIAAPVTEVSAVTVTAYPNPFTDRVKFSIISPVSGRASLDVYNMVGQKIRTIYSGHLFANRAQVVDYNVPSNSTGGLIYTLRVGNQQVNGKLVQVK